MSGETPLHGLEVALPRLCSRSRMTSPALPPSLLPHFHSEKKGEIEVGWGLPLLVQRQPFTGH